MIVEKNTCCYKWVAQQLSRKPICSPEATPREMSWLELHDCQQKVVQRDENGTVYNCKLTKPAKTKCEADQLKSQAGRRGSPTVWLRCCPSGEEGGCNLWDQRRTMIPGRKWEQQLWEVEVMFGFQMYIYDNFLHRKYSLEMTRATISSS